MFDLFRSRAKFVKFGMGFLLILVALSMVTYLIPGGMVGGGGQEQTVVAKIGSEVLTAQEVQQQMQSAMRNRRFSAQLAPFYARQMIDDMINMRVLTYEARRSGIEVTDADVVKAVRMMVPQLFPNGQFIGQAAYAGFLEQQGMTVERFESDLRQQILVSRLTGIVSDGIVVTPADIAKEYRRREEKAKLDYIAITPDRYRKEVNVTPEQIQAYYNQNRSQFQTPAKRSFDLLVADEAKLAQSINIPDAELRRYYDTNKDQYRVPDRVHVRHILLKTTDKPKDQIPAIQARAEALLKQVKGGADFAELARKNSEDPGSASKGGDLGWITRQQTVPAFEAAAFSLKPNEISSVIKTEYGFHILQVLEKETAHVKPFEEVKDQIAQERKRQQVFDTMQKLADQAHDELVKHPQQAAEIAAKLGLTLEHADKIAAGAAAPEFGTNPDFGEAIAALQPGGVTQVMQAPGNKLAVAVVTEVIPAKPADLADVQDQIRKTLTADKLSDLVSQKAMEAMNKAKASGDLKKVAQEMGLEVKSTQDFTVTGAADGIGDAGQLKQAFSEKVGSVFGPVSVNDSWFICKIANQIEPDMSKLDAAQRTEIRNTLKSERAHEQVQLFVDSIRSALTREGKIKINKEVESRVIASYRS